MWFFVTSLTFIIIMINGFEYLLVLLISSIFPILFSFHPRSPIKGNLKIAWLSIFIVSVPWIIWDVLVTQRGHWAFNEVYHLDYKVLGLPLEEYLFFWLIPYACLFIWVTMTKYDSVTQLVKDIFYLK